MGAAENDQFQIVAEIQRTKANQEALINCSEDLIWSVDKDLRIITANKSFQERIKKVTGKYVREGDSILVKEYGEQVNNKWAEYYDKALKGERFTIKEEIFNPRTERIEFWQVIFNPMYDAGEIFLGVACYSKNITEDAINLIALENAKSDLQKITDSSLIRNERFEYAMAATSDIIWDWNLETNAVYYSANIQKLFGHNKSGMNLDNLPFYFEHVHPDDRERVVLYPDQVKYGQMLNWTQEYRFKKADGEYAFVLDKGIVIRDEKGVGIRMIGAIQDITTLKQQNERLTEIAMINAHEIRRPVATILGLLSLFEESIECEPNRELIKHLQSVTLELDTVIKRIIDKAVD